METKIETIADLDREEKAAFRRLRDVIAKTTPASDEGFKEKARLLTNLEETLRAYDQG